VPPLCLTLSDGRSRYDTHVPPAAKLLAAPVSGLPGWHAAEFDSAHSVPDSGWWREISTDSIEIRWHHSPSIRLNLVKQRISGVAEPSVTLPLFFALTLESRSVSGMSDSCAGFSTSPPNVSLQQTGDLR
jgi:hypothetical protein